jgi:hypothetical protein
MLKFKVDLANNAAGVESDVCSGVVVWSNDYNAAEILLPL